MIEKHRCFVFLHVQPGRLIPALQTPVVLLFPPFFSRGLSSSLGTASEYLRTRRDEVSIRTKCSKQHVVFLYRNRHFRKKKKKGLLWFLTSFRYFEIFRSISTTPYPNLPPQYSSLSFFFPFENREYRVWRGTLKCIVHAWLSVGEVSS